MSIDAVINAIREHNKFLITSHINPEADALGSQLAAYELIRKLGKEAICINSDKIQAHYKFLPGIEHIKRFVEKGFDADAAIVLDCPTMNRTGKVKSEIKKKGTVINIDHHISNTEYGDANWVNAGASSCGEMIYKLYKKMGIDISKKTALYIYVAILTDTGSFNYSNTSAVTHEIVSELLEYGLKPGDISRVIYENKKMSDIKLLGKVISGLKTYLSGKVAVMVCTKKMIKDSGSSIHATENFINYARSIDSAQIAVFISEDPKKSNVYKVSFRSKGSVDVNKVAGSFGGGGHKNASGCTIYGALIEVKRRILTKAGEALKRRKI